MADIIDRYKKEHQQILALFDLVRKPGVSSKDCVRMLNQAKDIVLAHLADEEEYLYPKLYGFAQKDPNFKVALDFFVQNILEIADKFTLFINKYIESGGGNDFDEDLAQLISLLDERILKEEKILYAEYEQRVGDE